MARKQARFGQPAVYNSSAPTLTDGDDSALNVDVSGNLKTVSGGTGASANEIQGNAASGATDTGNPVKTGGISRTTQPTLTDGQRGDTQLDTRGNTKVTLMANNSTNGVSVLATSGDGLATSSTANHLAVSAKQYVFNGTSYDRMAGDTIATKVEQRFLYGRATADAQIKASAGFIHTITVAPTGTVTAGVLTVYDSLTETGTVITSVALPVTSFTPFSMILDVTAATGIYVGFDATLANVQATLAYR